MSKGTHARTCQSSHLVLRQLTSCFPVPSLGYLPHMMLSIQSKRFSLLLKEQWVIIWCVCRVITIHNNPENMKLPSRFKHLRFQLADVDTQDVSQFFDASYQFIEEGRGANEGWASGSHYMLGSEDTRNVASVHPPAASLLNSACGGIASCPAGVHGLSKVS